MAAVGRNDTVVVRHGLVHPHGNGFLAIGQMAEAPNVACFVLGVAGDLHTPDGVHLLKGMVQFVGGDLGGEVLVGQFCGK